ncbi:MAG: hypothetical protein U9N58_10230 [Thermodesulfobacteriota bacterium]|nr:hypothetical protein [Thermodesulfobacteriota bacterium]
MRKKNVPQDGGILGRWHEISYAIDDDGRYVLAPSVGWEPANIANKQAWELISKQVADVIKRIQAQELSPLAYYMVKNQMDTDLLAKYVRLSRWRVRRHLKPAVFRCLKVSILERYAKIFNVSAEQLFDISEFSSLDLDNVPQ